MLGAGSDLNGRQFVMAQHIKFLTFCALLSTTSPSPAKTVAITSATPPVSLLKADSSAGSLKVDQRQKAEENPDIQGAHGSGAAFRAPVVAWVPSGTPVELVRLSSRYGMRIHPLDGNSGMHTGVDLAGPSGTPVRSTAEGTINRAEWFGGYGLLVEIDHGAHLDTRYAHLSKIAVAVGQRVRKGDVVGYVGSTGKSTGPHLHYEVRMGGEAVDPTPFMTLSANENEYAVSTHGTDRRR